jgi:hypothetical protein
MEKAKPPFWPVEAVRTWLVAALVSETVAPGMPEAPVAVTVPANPPVVADWHRAGE